MEKYFISIKKLKFFVFMMAVALITAIGVTGCSDEENTSVDSVDRIVAVTGIELSNAQVELMARTKYQLTYTLSPSNATDRDVIWTSSNTAIATVVYGEITGVSAGTATITATTEDGGKTATCTVTVIPYIANAVTGVSLDALDPLPTAKKVKLVAKIAPANADSQNVTWASSNPDVATINAAGVLEALKPGTATITVTTEEGGFTASCGVTVTADFLIADFDMYEVGTAWKILSLNGDNPLNKADVVVDPAKESGNVLRIYGENMTNPTYGPIGVQLIPEFQVTLPTGKKLGDYSSLYLDMRFISGVDNGGTEAGGAGWYGGGMTLRFNDAAYGFANANTLGLATNPAFAVNIWARGIKMEFPADMTAEIKALTTFTLRVGTQSGATYYYMDNVILK